MPTQAKEISVRRSGTAAQVGRAVSAAAALLGLSIASPASAAVALGGAWTGGDSNGDTVAFAKPADPGSNRALVVTMAGRMSSQTATAPTCAGTYGGRTLVQVANSGAASSWRKACILVLSESEIALASGTALTVTMAAGGTLSGTAVRAAFLTGVDQGTLVSASTGNSSTNQTVSYPSALAAPANGAHVFVAGGFTNATSSSYTSSGGRTYVLEYFSATNVAIATYDRFLGASGDSDSITHTFNGSTNASAIAAIALNPAATQNVTIADGSNPGNTSISVGQTTAMDAFTVATNTGTATITQVLVNIPTNASALSNVSVNSASNCGGTAYGSLGAAPANGNNTISLGTSISATTSSGGTSYYVCVTGATVGADTNVTGTVTSVTAAGYTVTPNDTAGATVTVTPPPSLTIGQATAGEGATTIGPGSPEVVLDAFTLQAASGTANPSSITVAMPAGSAQLLSNVTIESTSACTQAIPYGAVANPASDTVVVPVSALSVGTTTTNLWVCLTPKSHAAMPAVPGQQVAVTGQVTTVVAAGYTQAGADGVSAARTIDNLSPGNATWGTITPGNGQVSLAWTNPVSDFSQVVILRHTASFTDAPVEGQAYVQGNTIGPATVRYAGTATSFVDTGLTNGTSYWYRIYAKDAYGNYSASGALTGPHTPTGPSLNLANATAGEGTSTLAPGDAAVALDAFALSTTAGTAAVSSVTVTMPAGSAALVGILSIENTQACNMATPYGSVTFPPSDTPAIPTAGLSVGTASVPLWVCVKPKLHTDMAVPPGTEVAVTGRVTAVVASGYTQAGSDTVSPARTIDNLSPNAPASFAGTTGDSQISLSWTNPSATDLSSVLVVRDTAAITWTPIEGATYVAGQSISGTLTVACLVSPATPGAASGCVDSPLANGTSYRYRAFGRDSRGNFSVAASAGPYIPSAGPTLAVGDGASEPADGTAAPGAAARALDAFTLSTNTGTASPTSLTVTLTAGVQSLLESVSIQNTSACNQATPYGTVSNPATATPAISLSGLSVGTGGVSLWVCAKPKTHAAMAAPPGSAVATTAAVTSVTAAGYAATYGDSGSATVTVDNASPAGPTVFSGTPGAGAVVLTWTNPAGADLAQVVVVRDVSPVTFTPTEGATYTAGQVLSGTLTVACVRGPPLVPLAGGNCSATGLANGTAYHFRAYAKDASGNYTALASAPQAGPYTPVAPVVDTITVGNGTNPANATIAPGSAASALDAFTLQASVGSATVSSVTVTLAQGSWLGLSAVTIQNTSACNMGSPLGSAATVSDSMTIAVSGLNVTTTAGSYWVCITPKQHAALTPPPGDEMAFTGTVTAITSSGSYAKSYLDLGSATLILDNKSPANAAWTNVTPASGQATLAWTNPGDADLGSVVVLRKSGGPVDVVPVEGASYSVGNTIGVATVRFSAAGTGFTDTGLTDGTAYYYAIFARDSRGNYAVGAHVGPVYPGGNPLPAGDTTPGSTRPVVAILNPSQGKVLSGSFRVQVRAFSPSGAVGAVEVTANAGGAWTSLARVNAYGVAPQIGVFETSLSLAAGSYTLVARATNGAGTTNSGPVGVTVVDAGTGDGNLLVRDNSSQLCGDCHAVSSHSSEATGSAKGSWAVVCRDCHTPHGTRNIYLVPERITPPALGGTVPAPREVFFSTKAGFSAAGGAANRGAASYANADGTGPCQVCHTRTAHFKSDGTGVTHNAGQRCTSCHEHGRGLGANCTDCHGTAGRTGPVSNVAAAPPVDTLGASTGVKVGAHLQHVTQTNFRTDPLQCSECHPAASEHNGTRDAGWSSLGTGGGTVAPQPPAGNGAYSAAWEATPTCANWCHGNGLAGGGGPASFTWTAAGPLSCSACHGAPPPVSVAANEDHPQNGTCASCHGTGYATSGLSAGAKATHIDGTIQKPASGCTACHGVLAGLAGAPVGNTDPTAAPGSTAAAVDTMGNSARTFPGVGAHIRHVNSGTYMSGKSCAVCHGTLPPSGTTTHANGTVLASWSAPASSGGVSPTPASFVGWTSPYNCTNYCHSNAAPAGGGSLSAPAISWTSTPVLGCTSCHSNIGRDQTGGTTASLSQKHGKHLNGATYAFTCDECHRSTMSDNSSTVIAGPASHVDGTKTVAFSPTLKSTTIDQSGGSYAGGACSATYCHSGGVATTPTFSGTASAALAWTTGTSTCRSCHGWDAAATPTIGVATGSSFQGSARHANHVSNAAVIGTNYFCGDCHAATVAAGTNSPVTTFANHVNGTKNVSVANRGSRASGAYDAGTQTCASNYCHSSGQAAPDTAYRTITWNGAALGCNGCHGTGNAAGSPDYGNGGAGSPTANSHAKHTGSGTNATSCALCHAGTAAAAGGEILAASTLHTNGLREVSFSGGGTYDSGTKTCSGTACHGASTPQWGGASFTCTSCHTGAGDQNSWNISDGTPSRIDNAQWTSSGHGSTSTAGNSFAEFNQAGVTDRCLYCHDGSVGHYDASNPFRLRGAAASNGTTAAYSAAPSPSTSTVAVCLNCHATSGTVAYGVDPDAVGSGQPKVGPATARRDAYHFGAKHLASNLGGERCWDCHDPHGDGNIKMVGADTLRAGNDVHGLTGTRSSTAAVFTAQTSTNYANTPGRTGICQVCHTATNYWRSTSEPTAHQAGANCMTCHDHQQPPNLAFKGAGDCTLCHNQVQGTRRNVVAEFRNTWSHKRSTSGGVPANTVVTLWDCVVCHMEGDASTGDPSAVHGNGVINLRDPDTGQNIKQVTFSGTPGSYTAGASDLTFTGFSRNLNVRLEADPNFLTIAAIQINQCLKCHDANGATAFNSGQPLNPLTTSIPGSSAGKPFGTTIAGTGYNGGTGLTACATGTNGCVTNIDDSFATTNSSYHPVRGKQNNWYAKLTRMVAPWNATGRGGTVNATSWGDLISCWDCHAPNGTASTVTLTSTVTAHGGATTLRGVPAVTGTPSTTNTVTLCQLCHAGYNTTESSGHGAGSALNANLERSEKRPYLQYGCNGCHSSGYSTAVVRPIRAEDVHGMNALRPGATVIGRWAGTARGTPAQVDARPYAFIRNASGGSISIRSHEPARIGGSTYSAQCYMGPTGTCSRGSYEPYGPGGTF